MALFVDGVTSANIDRGLSKRCLYLIIGSCVVCFYAFFSHQWVTVCDRVDGECDHNGLWHCNGKDNVNNHADHNCTSYTIAAISLIAAFLFNLLGTYLLFSTLVGNRDSCSIFGLPHSALVLIATVAQFICSFAAMFGPKPYQGRIGLTAWFMLVWAFVSLLNCYFHVLADGTTSCGQAGRTVVSGGGIPSKPAKGNKKPSLPTRGNVMM